jgi:hypothetical protein
MQQALLGLATRSTIRIMVRTVPPATYSNRELAERPAERDHRRAARTRERDPRRDDFTPAALRADLAERRLAPRLLYRAAELIDHAADLLVQGAVLVHESERRLARLL